MGKREVNGHMAGWEDRGPDAVDLETTSKIIRHNAEFLVMKIYPQFMDDSGFNWHGKKQSLFRTPAMEQMYGILMFGKPKCVPVACTEKHYAGETFRITKEINSGKLQWFGTDEELKECMDMIPNISREDIIKELEEKAEEAKKAFQKSKQSPVIEQVEGQFEDEDYIHVPKRNGNQILVGLHPIYHTIEFDTTKPIKRLVEA